MCNGRDVKAIASSLELLVDGLLVFLRARRNYRFKIRFKYNDLPSIKTREILFV